MTEPEQSGFEEISGGGRTRAEPLDSACGDACLSHAYPATPASIAAIRSMVGEFAARAGVPQPLLDRAVLAVSEAATNVVNHAYNELDEAGSIQIEAIVAGDELRVTVIDTGGGLRARSGGSGLGLGLTIIRKLADDIELLHSRRGLHVLMRFASPQRTIDP